MFRLAQHDNDGKSQAAFEAWSLRFPWNLGFGIWCFRIKGMNARLTFCLCALLFALSARAEKIALVGATVINPA